MGGDFVIVYCAGGKGIQIINLGWRVILSHCQDGGLNCGSIQGMGEGEHIVCHTRKCTIWKWETRWKGKALFIFSFLIMLM